MSCLLTIFVIIKYDVKIDKKILIELKRYLKKQIEFFIKELPIKTYSEYVYFVALNIIEYFYGTVL